MHCQNSQRDRRCDNTSEPHQEPEQVTRQPKCIATAVLAAVAVVGLTTPAFAEYPERPVTLIVGSVPGSGPDYLARSMSEELSAELGQPIVVENQPGAAGNVAAEAFTRAEPDGYQIYIGTINMTIATWLPAEPPYDPATDFAYVGRVGALPDVIAVNKSLGINSIEELIEKAKAAPGELNFSSPGAGSLQQMGANALAAEAGESGLGYAVTSSRVSKPSTLSYAGFAPPSCTRTQDPRRFQHPDNR